MRNAVAREHSVCNPGLAGISGPPITMCQAIGGGTEYLWPGETHWQYLPKDCVATRLNGLSGRGCVCLWLIDVLKQRHYGLQAGIIQSDSFLFKWK